MNKKKDPRRAISMATMHGRFQGEKRRAAQAIAARNAEDDSTTAAEDDNDDNNDNDDNDDEWEDDDDEDDDDGWEDETPSDPKPVQAQPMARQTSRGLQLPPIQLPVSAATKKQRQAEKARLEAEREAQRQREMFAKQQIFGHPQGGEGLLTRQFKTGKSMVDLTKAGEEAAAAPPGLRRAPTHANFSVMGQSPTAGPPNLMRSKSTAAMPVQTGVSVTSRRSQNSGHSDEKRGPEGVEMESSDESEDDDYLASTAVERKLSQLAAKRAAKDSGANSVPIVPNGSGNGANQALDENGVVRPLSPTTRRRTIIMREMSESLRRSEFLVLLLHETLTPAQTSSWNAKSRRAAWARTRARRRRRT